MPTATSGAASTPSPVNVPRQTAVPPTQQISLNASNTALLERVGVSGSPHDVDKARDAGLEFGLFLDWRTKSKWSADVEFWQMVRLSEAGMVEPESWEVLATAVAAQPGSVWIMGNEPDVIWQDNITPERYAELYHETSTFIKARDATAQIAMGGVSQSTPLRLAYLDRILMAYEAQFGQPMPVDVWTVHAFILREERDSWGVDIPPSMTEDEGILYEIADHDDLAIFEANIRAFRQWLWQRGYGERPLAITEFGILMPFDYGFPPEAVAAFMSQTFDFLQTARDETTGYAADDYRLVQWWFWYNLHDPDLYPTSNLYDRQTGELTQLGQAWQAYLDQHTSDGN